MFTYESTVTIAHHMANKMNKSYDIVHSLLTGEYHIFQMGQKDRDPNYELLAIVEPQHSKGSKAF